MSLIKEAQRKSKKQSEHEGDGSVTEKIEEKDSFIERLPVRPIVLSMVGTILGFIVSFWIGTRTGPLLVRTIRRVISSFL